MCPPSVGLHDCFLFVKHVTTVLQHSAAAARSDPSKSSKDAARPVKALLFLDHAVRDALCSYAESAHVQGAPALQQRLLQSVARALAAAGSNEPHDDEACARAARQVTAHRCLQLDLEIQHLQTLPLDSCRVDLLARVITQLRALEVDVELHARVAQEVRAQVDSSEEYSEVNFAYGSTPYSSWYQTLHHPLVHAAAAAAMAPPGRRCMVWGSSLGWLVFFSALTFQWRCSGYELLSSLHRCACELAEQLGLEGEATTFENADLLTSNLSDVGVLVVADQCWDRDLMVKAAAKMGEELAEGSVVVSYSAWWGEARGGGAACGLRQLAQVAVPVSWNDGARLYAFVRGRDGGREDEGGRRGAGSGRQGGGEAGGGEESGRQEEGEAGNQREAAVTDL